jgi:2-dehydropantoate 2-reductase
VRDAVPDIEKESLPPYDYIVLTTKNIPDIPPTVATLVSPALSPSNTHTTLVLIQNGLNIEKPLIAAYPTTPILSGVSLIGSVETALGTISQEDHDRLLVGGFHNPNIAAGVSEAKAKEFVEIYGAGGKTDCVYDEDVSYSRWRKLVYNACLNPICAITGLDTGRIRLASGGIEGLVRPAMLEIIQAARACGAMLGDDVADTMIAIDPLELYLKPSMLVDVEKVCVSFAGRVALY